MIVTIITDFLLKIFKNYWHFLIIGVLCSSIYIQYRLSKERIDSIRDEKEKLIVSLRETKKSLSEAKNMIEIQDENYERFLKYTNELEDIKINIEKENGKLKKSIKFYVNSKTKENKKNLIEEFNKQWERILK